MVHSYTVDITPVENMMTGVSSSFGDFVTAALPILGGIACFTLVFFFWRFAFSLVRRFLSLGSDESHDYYQYPDYTDSDLDEYAKSGGYSGYK